MILPELGGRVQMAYDKIRERHFIYYNHVIKPALVGLAGPWISGGIEFNWPQHHRPSTYMPVDTTIEENADGSVTVWVNEMERMFHQKGMAGLRFVRDMLFLKSREYFTIVLKYLNLPVVGKPCRSGERLLSERIPARYQCRFRPWKACRIQFPHRNGYLLQDGLFCRSRYLEL